MGLSGGEKGWRDRERSSTTAGSCTLVSRRVRASTRNTDRVPGSLSALHLHYLIPPQPSEVGAVIVSIRIFLIVKLRLREVRHLRQVTQLQRGRAGIDRTPKPGQQSPLGFLCPIREGWVLGPQGRTRLLPATSSKAWPSLAMAPTARGSLALPALISSSSRDLKLICHRLAGKQELFLTRGQNPFCDSKVITSVAGVRRM